MADVLYCICIHEIMWHHRIGCFELFVQGICILVMIPLQETRYEQEKQNIPFTLHGSRRGLSLIRSAKKNCLKSQKEKAQRIWCHLKTLTSWWFQVNRPQLNVDFMRMCDCRDAHFTWFSRQQKSSEMLISLSKNAHFKSKGDLKDGFFQLTHMLIWQECMTTVMLILLKYRLMLTRETSDMFISLEKEKPHSHNNKWKKSALAFKI